jgi:hypothetical protein
MLGLSSPFLPPVCWAALAPLLFLMHEGGISGKRVFQGVRLPPERLCPFNHFFYELVFRCGVMFECTVVLRHRLCSYSLGGIHAQARGSKGVSD